MQFPDARGDGTQSRTTKDVTDANPQITPNSLPEVEKDVTRTRKHFPAHSPMIGGRRPKDVTIFPSAIRERCHWLRIVAQRQNAAIRPPRLQKMSQEAAPSPA